MAKKKFSDLPATTSIGASDLLATSQVDADAQSGYTSKKITGGNVARSINAGIEYPTDLETEDKTIIGAINEINSKALAIDSASGDIASFDTAISAPLVSLSTTIVAKGGGGTPSTPIPIVGYSEVNLKRCGVNFWDGVTESGFIYNGSEGSDPSYWRTKNYIPIAPNTEYYFRAASGNGQINWYDKDKVFISAVNSMGGSTRLATSPANAAYARFYQPVSSDASDSGVNYPSSDTSYHAYNGQTITIALGQTVYGGYITKNANGNWDLTVTSAKDTFDGSNDETWNGYISGDVFLAYIDLHSSNKLLNYTGKILSDKFSVVADHTQVKTTPYLMSGYKDTNNTYPNQNWLYFDLPNTITSVAEARAWASNNPFEVVYELATPFTIDLSSSDMLDAVVGINNVFSDCGVTSLTFIDKMQHYVDKKIAELQALILQ